MFKRAASIFLATSLATVFFLMVSIKQAHAYIDFGTGSFLLQILVASAFGALFTLKVFWQSVTGKVSRFVSKIKRAEEDSA